ncbi:hypothetical protein PR048_005206 [Dryococelus australis]|uniref:Uncharacterized protein n=1 Tax=Dryococelus australis TaxID=614101 RepID=A0ABQ9I7L7_9NEOP|nr:hypothetical protein PR048_005206 [Dryococelus australis]
MHKVISPRGHTVSTICKAYIKYVKSHYPGRSFCVVFDGYTNSPNSTKAAEQEQWYRMKKSSDINLNLNTEITPLDKSTIAVIGGAVDLVVLLMAKTPPDRDILLVKSGRGKIKTNVYSTKEIEQLGLKDILFLHAFKGCDKSSAAFRKSEVGFIELYKKNRGIHKAAEFFFQNPPQHTLRLRKRGRNVSRWYGATAKETSLILYHYQAFVKSVANIKPDISSLPTIEGAAKQHSYGIYHQVQQCRKASLKCSPVCHNCNGNRLNCKLENEDDDDEELELPPTIVQELDENMEENEDKAYELQPGPSRPKRSKLL